MCEKVFQIVPTVQNYAWGKIGLNSKVAELISNAYPEIEIDKSQTYAELWMGTHPNGPSVIKNTGELLKSYISKNPELLTTDIAAKYGDLPFLFKVLSIRKALSIQAHPDKKLAEYLFQNFPDKYKDDNHKPEMAIALTPFEGLCGFRPHENIKNNIQKYPEIIDAIGKEIVDEFMDITKDTQSKNVLDIERNKNALKNLYRSLMEQNHTIIKTQLDKLISRISKIDPNPPKGTLDEVLIRIEKQYPGDVGIFSIFLLNFVSLKPGEGLYLAANEPHAYVSGDCIECMAASDNVVRAGLTPKFKDVETLVDMLTYTCKSADNQIVSGSSYLNSTSTVLYNPPIEEFSILCTTLSSDGIKSETFEGVKGPSIILTTEGKGRIIYNEKIFDTCAGSVFFVGANTSITLETSSNKTIFYRAYSELSKIQSFDNINENE
ncbi:mannose-6-phosphate isomerase [Neocallimastix californiae]|uniref:Mannose-6-phosphate isomerase n=1 Tax=Neocallimastix californiae TaxID=1754190 RepID=A0A1Y2AEN3_9FUNG|nr:mannose-6-phosphate isomerase [Neocallimastix californiae]|eukprot:ORY20727.1 mannose-6-phosphate isomerase [Neocallimastix californiae]